MSISSRLYFRVAFTAACVANTVTASGSGSSTFPPRSTRTECSAAREKMKLWRGATASRVHALNCAPSKKFSWISLYMQTMNKSELLCLFIKFNKWRNYVSICVSNQLEPLQASVSVLVHFLSYSLLWWGHREGKSRVWSSQGHICDCDHRGPTHCLWWTANQRKSWLKLRMKRAKTACFRQKKLTGCTKSTVNCKSCKTTSVQFKSEHKWE